MPAAIPLAFQIGAALLAQGTGALVSSLIVGAATLAGSYVAGKLAKGKSKTPTDLRANYVSTEAAIPIIYGTRMVGGNDVFSDVGRSGGVGSSGKYLWVVQILGEGVIEGINQIEVEGFSTPQDEIYIDGTLFCKLKNRKYIDYWLYTGTPDQDYDTTLYAGTKLKKPEDEKHTDTYRNLAYIIFRFRVKKYKTLPRREVGVKGIKCYDPRILTPPTVVFTRNPALILLDYITNERYGLGWDYSLVDEESFIVAANYCEKSDDKLPWNIDYVISTTIKAQDVIDSILMHFRGSLFWYNGKLELKVLDLNENTPVLEIYDEHILRDGKGIASVGVSQPSRFDIPDNCLVSYINPRDNWTLDRFTVDNSSKGLTKTIDFEGYTERALAEQMGYYLLERERLCRSISLSLRMDAVKLDSNDLVTITSSELAFSNQLARITSCSFSSSGNIGVTALLESDTLYDSQYQPDYSTVYSVDLISPTDHPPRVENVSVSEEEYDYRGTTYIRLKIDFEPPDGYLWFDHVDVYVYEKMPEGDLPTEDSYRLRLSAESSFKLDPVGELITYYIKLVAVSTYGIAEELDECVLIQHKVIGVSGEVPPCPPYMNMSVNLTAIDITSTPVLVTDAEDEKLQPDIKGYEIRLGETWRDAIFLDLRSSPSVSYTSVKPSGASPHTFWLSTKHDNGNYCDLPLSKTANISDPPPGSKGFYSQEIVYANGILDNMEITVPDGKLRLLRTGATPTIGTFTSEVIDTGNETATLEMLVYVLFDFSLDVGLKTWEYLAPSPMTWEEFCEDPVTGRYKKWSEILIDPVYSRIAGNISVELQYSDSETGPWKAVSRLELLSVLVIGRYVKLKYTVEDPNTSSFMEIGISTLKAAYIEKNLLIGP